MSRSIDALHVSELTLWHSPSFEWQGERNDGYQRVVDLLGNAEQRKSVIVTVVDCTGLDRDGRAHLYLQMAVTASVWKYEVRRVFGTHGSPGLLACREVPMLKVKFKEKGLYMVAPHLDTRYKPGRLVTALDALKQLSSQEQIDLFGHLA